MKALEFVLLSAIVVAGISLPAGLSAAEIKGLFAAGVGVVTQELTPVFERSSGHKVAITYRVIGTLKDLLEHGEVADIIIATPTDLVDLEKQGKVVSGTTVAIARTGIGVAVRAGSPKPDVTTVEAFKQSLLNAKSFGYVDPAGGAGPSRPIVAMFERLGINAELRAKAKFVPNGRSLFEAITKQEADLGVYIINEIVTTPGIDLAGPVPSELQFYIRYAAAILARSPEPALAKELISFLSSPAAGPVIKSKGMDRD
jgi:molybdate transport system substrate-binding protein